MNVHTSIIAHCDNEWFFSDIFQLNDFWIAIKFKFLKFHWKSFQYEYPIQIIWCNQIIKTARHWWCTCHLTYNFIVIFQWSNKFTIDIIERKSLVYQNNYVFCDDFFFLGLPLAWTTLFIFISLRSSWQKRTQSSLVPQTNVLNAWLIPIHSILYLCV